MPPNVTAIKEESMREFRQFHGRTGVRYWMISFEAKPGQAPEILSTKWGLIKDGHHSEHGATKDRPGPKGKKNTKAYMTAAENACFNMDRMIRKKMEEGYVEVGLDGRPLLGGAADEIDFDESLPKNLCFSKPRNTVSDSFIKKQEKAGNIIWTTKYNGMMVVAQLDSGGVPNLYSRRMDDLTEHFPHLTAALLKMSFPGKSILLFEAYMGEGKKKKDLLRCQSIMRSKAEKAVQKQEDDEWMTFYLIRLPVWKGQLLEHLNTCEKQCQLIENTFTERFMEYRDPAIEDQFLFTLENFDGTAEEADELAEKHGLEGWVGYLRDAVMGGHSFSFHGKPDRPSCCFKRKAEYEDDFIAYFDPEKSTKEFPMGSWGSGKNMGKVGTFSLYQMDPKTGEVIYICEVGSGFTDKQRTDFLEAEFPLVAVVKYTSRQYTSEGDDTNALEFPRFDQQHPDKTTDEIYNPKIQSP
jgi:hypothetical protein